ncbi:MAG: TIGR04255 family protein [Chloroflexota bacterium]|nr:TIGR04255 family protein [Anaerolineae bacterium]
MKTRILRNKPLVEAIFELRWELQSQQGGIRVDPHYGVLVGRLYERVREDYPFHEPLPTATIPEEIAGYVIQHRFRCADGEWPLVQVGPGVVTLNDTREYTWEDFKRRIVALVGALFEAHLDAERGLRVSRVLLRYINAVEFDYSRSDLFHFLKDELKISIEMDEALFENTEVTRVPLGLDARLSFALEDPKGTLHVRFARGEREGSPSVVWETNIQSSGEDAPQSKEVILGWADKAHGVTEDWFFETIEGDLQRRFE